MLVEIQLNCMRYTKGNVCKHAKSEVLFRKFIKHTDFEEFIRTSYKRFVKKTKYFVNSIFLRNIS